MSALWCGRVSQDRGHRDRSVAESVPLYDVVIATDLRLGGGSGESTLQEIRAQHAAGLRTGIYHLESPMVKPGKTTQPDFAHALRHGQCELLNFTAGIKTRLLLFRHPTVIDHFGS